MVTIGYHASHEIFPSELRLCPKLRKRVLPRASAQTTFARTDRESGFAWRGSALPCKRPLLWHGVCPGRNLIQPSLRRRQRLRHDRFWIAVGSGQALNEHITGDPWPRKPERNTRLKESVDVMRALWNGETVTHRGLVVVEDAKLYTLPDRAPKIIGAAITPETAEWVGGWADGLITIVQPKDTLSEVVQAFRQGGGEGKPMFLQVQLSYAEDKETARQVPTSSGVPTSSAALFFRISPCPVSLSRFRIRSAGRSGWAHPHFG